MADMAALTALIEPEARALGFDLVRVMLFGGGDDLTLQIMAERPDTRQLKIDDCAALSRRISEKLDELEAKGEDPIETAYRLEVSSPGIDRPLTRLKDYTDWHGHEAKIEVAEAIEGRKRFQGIITGVADGVIALKDRKNGDLSVPFDRVEAAKLVLTDALISATVPLSTEGADDIITQEQED